MSEKINDTEIGHAPAEDPLNIHRSASDEKTLVSEENVIAPVSGKKQVSRLLSKHF